MVKKTIVIGFCFGLVFGIGCLVLRLITNPRGMTQQISKIRCRVRTSTTQRGRSNLSQPVKSEDRLKGSKLNLIQTMAKIQTI